jgi:hypothetical protein
MRLCSTTSRLAIVPRSIAEVQTPGRRLRSEAKKTAILDAADPRAWSDPPVGWDDGVGRLSGGERPEPGEEVAESAGQAGAERRYEEKRPDQYGEAAGGGPDEGADGHAEVPMSVR